MAECHSFNWPANDSWYTVSCFGRCGHHAHKRMYEPHYELWCHIARMKVLIVIAADAKNLPLSFSLYLSHRLSILSKAIRYAMLHSMMPNGVATAILACVAIADRQNVRLALSLDWIASDTIDQMPPEPNCMFAALSPTISN